MPQRSKPQTTLFPLRCFLFCRTCNGNKRLVFFEEPFVLLNRLEPIYLQKLYRTGHRDNVIFCWQVLHRAKILSLSGLTCLTENRASQHPSNHICKFSMKILGSGQNSKHLEGYLPSRCVRFFIFLCDTHRQALKPISEHILECIRPFNLFCGRKQILYG